LIGSELPELWTLRGDQENAVLFIQERLTAGDEIVIASSDGTAVWYYAELYGVSDAFYNADEEFDRLFVLVNPAEDESVETVVVAQGPQLDRVDLDAAQWLQTIGNLQIYLVPKK
jgi:hypothetical protein